MLKNHTKVCAIACSIMLSLGLAACGGDSKQAPETATEETAVVETTATETETPEVTAQETTTTTTEAAPVTEAAPTTTETPAEATYISADEAKNIALADAGADEASIAGLSIELDTDDMVVHYDVDFKFQGLEYDYEIDATTGAIMLAQSEIDD